MLLKLFYASTFVSASVVGLVPSLSHAQDSLPTPAASAPLAQSPVVERYVPHRVYDTKRNRFVDFETMVAALIKSDVIFLGEQHDDPGTHRLQAAVLEGAARRHEGPIVLALEMFERDVQPHLDAYLAGVTDEATFLAASRPWGNYPADYRPMVELARENGWPVIAGNVPRRLAQIVSRRGLIALDSIPAADSAFIAAKHSCPRDEYWRRFRGVMGDMSGHGMQLSPEQVEAFVWRTYEAQCVKDEAMGEAIVRSLVGLNTLVIHANGSFHSNYRLGTVDRVKWRAPSAKLAVVSFVPVRDLDAADGRSRRKLGDYVVFTLAPTKPAPATATTP
jgi:uncharacterized iron-regulated protein